MDKNQLFDYSSRLKVAQGRQMEKQDRLQKCISTLDHFQEKLPAIEEAQALIQVVATELQEKLSIRIEDIVQVAIDTCWPGDMLFKVKFEKKRGRTEARLILEDEEGYEVDPMMAEGGGLVDIISFALRLSCWTLSNTDGVIILDEPFKWPSKEYKPLAVALIPELSKRLGLQFIIVTHDEEIIEVADRVFSVKKGKGGISKVEVK